MSNPMRKDLSRLGLATLGWVVLILALGTVTAYWQTSEVEEAMRADLLVEAQRLAATLNRERLAAFSGTLADLELPEYQRLKRQLQAARHANPNWRFIYLMARLPDQRIIFWIDSEPPGSEDESQPGEVYDGMFLPEELRVFDPGIALTTLPSEDQWGVWISALVPIPTIDGHASELALGIDIDVSDWRRQLLVRAVVPVAVATLVLLTVAVLGAFLFAQRSRRRTAKACSLRWLEPALVVAVGLVLTVTTGWIIHSQGQRDQARAFQLLADASMQGAAADLHNLRDFGLDALARFFQVSDRVDSPAFRHFTDQLVGRGLSEHWAWAPRVPVRERLSFEQEMQSRGLHDFRIWEIQPKSPAEPDAADRAWLYPLTLTTERIQALEVDGMDLAAVPHVRTAIEAAEDSGLATALGPLDGDYLPPLRGHMLIFQPTGPRLGPAAREGVVITSATFDDIVSAWSGAATLNLELWLLHEDGAREPLTESAPDEERVAVPVELWLERPVLALGETFLIRAAPGPAFIAAQRNLSGARTLLAGSLLSLMLAIVVGLVTRRRETLEQAVRERTAALQEFRAAVEQSNDGITLTDMNGQVQFVNPAWAKMHACTAEEALGRHLRIFHTQEQFEEQVNPGIQQLLEDGHMIADIGHVDRLGNRFPTRMSASLIRNDQGAPYRILGIARDTSEEQQQREREHFNQRFQTLVADIAAGFVSAAEDQTFDDQLDHALASLGQLFHVDRAYLFQFSTDRANASNSHEWCAGGIESQKAKLQAVSMADMPWWLEHLREKRPIQIEDVEKLPPAAAAERHILQRQSIRSLVSLPMQDAQAQLLGWIGFDSVRTQRHWPREQIHMLQAVADILAGAMRRREIMQDLAKSEARFRELARESRSFRWQVDLDGVYTDVDPLVNDVLGYLPEQLIGKTHFYDLAPEADRELVRREGLQQIRSGLRFTGYENRIQTRDGRILWVSTTALPLFDDEGRQVGVRGSDTDITERKRAQLQIEHAAHHDLLTGLPNRVLLADRMQQAMAQAQRRKELLGVACLDLDEFKPINDRYGHAVGDRLLITVAQRMQQALRDGDTVARLGGDEFALVLVGLRDIESCRPLLRRLLDAVAEPIAHEGHQLRVSVSLGISFYPQSDAVDADQLLREADQAMYQAKLGGRNRYHFFDAEHDRALRTANRHLDRIRQGLEHEEFVLHYQPKVDMNTGSVVGVEALIRWQHPEQGLLPPTAFLPALRQHPLMISLGDRVLETALARISAWREAGWALPVSVNIDPLQLVQPDFIDGLASLLDRYPAVQPGDLELEVVETSALDETAPMAEIIAEAARHGIRFSLDDFGTGYSSLSYLKRLPVAALKIDRSFVRDMLHDPDDLVILRGIISLAQTFRHEVIAEGVETEAHGKMLLQLGCRLGQGYAIARPMPGDAIPVWLEQWHPPRSWLEVEPVDNARLPLLDAMVEYSAWRDRLHQFLSGSRSESAELGHPATEFLHWLDQGGAAMIAPADRWRIAHHRLHSVAVDLLALAQAGQRDQALARFGEIEAHTEQVLAVLEGHLHRPS